MRVWPPPSGRWRNGPSEAVNHAVNEAHEMVDDDIVAFDPFQLKRTKRTLSKVGSSITVRSRAMALLLALIEKAGAIVSNRASLERLWSNVAVKSGTL